jgi:hypothetical protein
MKKLFLTAAVALTAIPAFSRDSEAALQKTYDTLRSKLSPKEREVLKQIELKWVDQTKGLTGDAAEKANRDQVEWLKRWLDLVTGNSVVQGYVPDKSEATANVKAADLVAPKVVGTGTIHKGALIADSPEDRKKALDLIFQQDEESFVNMARDGKVIVVKDDTQAFIDDVYAFKGLVKVHFRGASDLPYYVDIKDFDMVKP